MAHLKSLTKELKTATSLTVKMHKGCKFIHKLKIAIDCILNANTREEQRVSMSNTAAPPAMTSVELPIQQITEAPPIVKAWDPTAKRNLINTKCTHRHQMCINTPGDVPAITRVPPQIIPTDFGMPHEKQRLTRVLTQRTYPSVEFTPGPIIIPPYPVPGGIRASACSISQQALNMLTMKEALNPPRAFTPKHFVHKSYEDHI